MIDVAEHAGVSRTTASFVLNGRDASIPHETRQRVHRAARQLGYRPSATARELATGRTQRIGIIIDSPYGFGSGDLYFTEVLTGIFNGVVENNFNLLLYCAKQPGWHEMFDQIMAGAADGVLLTGAYLSVELTHALLDAGFPTVCISYQVDHPKCHSVDCDNELGGQMAVQHLLELGHRNIAFFYPGEGSSWGEERHRGAKRAIIEAGLPESALSVLQWPENVWDRNIYSELTALFLRSQSVRPTALIACDEARGLGLLETLPRFGISIPSDISIISFNSTEASARARPSLSSIGQPLRDIGAAAVDMLVDLIEQREPEKQIMRLPVRLDVRESTAPK
jgi:LacI family transcriptional regulator